MATGLGNQGLVGLTHQVGKRQASKDDLNTLGQMYQMKQEQEAQEAQAAALEQQYYEKISAEADKLLANDRKAINEKARGLQVEIRKNIKLFGGSTKKFMANGGISMIGDYKNDLLGSEEFQTFKENKVNMERILDIKEKKLGHLLTPRDQMALEEYQRTGKGKITYSGLMNEIIIPESDLYNRDYQMSAQDIIATDSNTMRLISNYALENPDAPIIDPNTQEGYNRLIAYTHTKGYSGKGSYVDPYAQQRSGVSRGKGSGSGNLKANSDVIRTIAGDLSYVYSGSKDVNLKDMTNGELNKQEYFTATFGNNSYTQSASVGQSFGGYFAKALSAQMYEQGINFRPKGAHDLGDTMAMPLFQLQNGKEYTNENGWIQDFRPTKDGNTFNADGSPLDEHYDAGKWKADGAFAGYSMNTKNGNVLVMDVLNDDARDINEDINATLYGDTKDELKGKQDIFIRLTNEDGESVYQRVNYDSMVKQSQLGDFLAESNDLADNQEEANQKAYKERENFERRAIQKIGKPINEVTNEGFDDDYFQEELKSYNAAGTGSTNLRANIIKSYYLAMKDLIENPENPENAMDFDIVEHGFKANSFKQWADTQLGLENDLKNFKMTDYDLLKKLEQRIIEESAPEEELSNKIFFAKIKNYYNKLHKN